MARFDCPICGGPVRQDNRAEHEICAELAQTRRARDPYEQVAQSLGRAEGQRVLVRNRPTSRLRAEELREHRRQTMRALWQDPVYRARQLAALAEKRPTRSPDKLRAMTRASQSSWSRAKRAVAMRAVWQRRKATTSA